MCGQHVKFWDQFMEPVRHSHLLVRLLALFVVDEKRLAKTLRNFSIGQGRIPDVEDP
jgi:hypothetical protein